MADLVFSIKTVTIGDVVDNITNWASRKNVRDIGVTQGGATITMEATNLEINSDQNMDPEATVLTGYPKTITVNALDLVPANLALAFGGTVDGTTVNIPAAVTISEKSVEIKTKSETGLVEKTIKIPRCSIIPSSNINLNNSGAAVLVFTGKVLSPSAGNAVQIA